MINMKTSNKIYEVCKKLKAEGKIKTWYWNTWRYWDNVPQIELNNGALVTLAEEYLYMGSKSIKTLESKTKTEINKIINKIIENEKYLRSDTCYDYKHALDAKRMVEIQKLCED